MSTIAEPHWGDPARQQVRRDTTHRERVAGIVWLCVGALAACFLAVLYLGSHLTIGTAAIPLPWPLVATPWFLIVLTRTALLWTSNRAIATIPLWTWLGGYFLFLLWPALPGLGGDTLLGSTLATLLLLPAGLAGGGWALLRLK